MLKYVIIMNFIARIFAQYCLEHYLCNILVFFVRKRLRIKMGQMVTERGNHLFLYTFQLKIFALAVQVTRFARDFWLHLGKLSKLICTRFAQKFLIPNS